MADLKQLRPEDMRDAHQMPVDRLEIALVVPILIQAKKSGDKTFVDSRSDPASNHSFLARWVQEITAAEHPEVGTTVWTEVPSGYPPLDGTDAEPAYSEFCYFHPFVRNFLYVTRGDIRAAEKAEEEACKKQGRRPPTGVSARKALIQGSPNRNLRILERQGLQELLLEFAMDVPGQKGYQQFKSVFRIESCWLYLFDTQIAMLGVRLQHRSTVPAAVTGTTGAETASDAPAAASGDAARKPAGGLDLRKVLKIQDIVRRLYSPYWDTFRSDGKVKHLDGHVPDRVTLFQHVDGASHTRTVSSSFGNFATEESSEAKIEAADFSRIGDAREGVTAVKRHLRNVFCEREPYTVEVWRELLWPLLPTTYEPGTKRSFPLCFEHIQDDRAMLMSHIAVGDPAPSDRPAELQPNAGPRGVRRIKTGDWLRLATLDDPGDSGRYPYSPTFFEDPDNPLADFAYDRFWHPTGAAPGQDRDQTTRWLCCGYGFLGVGDAASGFFNDEHSGALCHFRHHYFALAMIAQFHRSSLLNYKHRLAEAADAMLTDEETNNRLRQLDFREGVELLVKEMMRFRTLYWFIEVSNQIQGRELFDMFRKHLNLQALFDDVYGDAEAAVGLLRQWDAEDETRASQSLAVLGAVFLVLGPLISYLDSWPPAAKPWAYVSATLLLAGLVMLFVRIPSAWLVAGSARSRRFWRQMVRWPVARKTKICGALGATGLLGFIAIGLICWLGSRGHTPSSEPPAKPARSGISAVGSGESVRPPGAPKVPSPREPTTAPRAAPPTAGRPR